MGKKIFYKRFQKMITRSETLARKKPWQDSPSLPHSFGFTMSFSQHANAPGTDGIFGHCVKNSSISKILPPIPMAFIEWEDCYKK